MAAPSHCFEDNRDRGSFSGIVSVFKYKVFGKGSMILSVLKLKSSSFFSFVILLKMIDQIKTKRNLIYATNFFS